MNDITTTTTTNEARGRHAIGVLAMSFDRGYINDDIALAEIKRIGQAASSIIGALNGAFSAIGRATDFAPGFRLTIEEAHVPRLNAAGVAVSLVPVKDRPSKDHQVAVDAARETFAHFIQKTLEERTRPPRQPRLIEAGKLADEDPALAFASEFNQRFGRQCELILIDPADIEHSRTVLLNALETQNDVDWEHGKPVDVSARIEKDGDGSTSSGRFIVLNTTDFGKLTVSVTDDSWTLSLSMIRASGTLARFRIGVGLRPNGKGKTEKHLVLEQIIRPCGTFDWLALSARYQDAGSRLAQLGGEIEQTTTYSDGTPIKQRELPGIPIGLAAKPKTKRSSTKSPGRSSRKKPWGL